MLSPSTGDSQEKQLFWVLHGMRGIGAILVCIMHIGPLYVGFQGYLAVDFFFLLSGFVICHAYDQELRQGLSPWRFMQRRLLRLYPVYALGISLPLFIGLLFSVTQGLVWQTRNIWVCYILNMLYLPAPEWANVSNYSVLYPMNMVAWSLAFELLAYVAYCFGHRLFEGRRMVLWLLVFGAVLIFSTFYYGQ